MNNILGNVLFKYFALTCRPKMSLLIVYIIAQYLYCQIYIAGEVRKRKCDFDTKSGIKTKKAHIQEGFSWWTCLQYGMSYEKTKPHPVSAASKSSSSP